MFKVTIDFTRFARSLPTPPPPLAEFLFPYIGVVHKFIATFDICIAKNYVSIVSFFSFLLQVYLRLFFVLLRASIKRYDVQYFPNFLLVIHLFI